MWNKFLNFILENNTEFFRGKFHTEKEIIVQDLNIEEIYEQYKPQFHQLLIEEFTGYIPKEVNEPVVKIFSEQSVQFERWVLWQSYYINKKSLNDPAKLEFYKGMMLYFKLLHLLAIQNKRVNVTPARTPVETEKDKEKKPWVEDALQGIEDFKHELSKVNQTAADGEENTGGQDAGSTPNED